MNNMKLRVCVTKQCNFNCIYCKPGGEGHNSDGDILKSSELIKILKELRNLGIESFRITGGEPMLRKDFFNLMKKIKNIQSINKVTMVTNGSMINELNINNLIEIGFKSITVSLDTLDSKKYYDIVKVDCLNNVIKNILMLKNKNMKVKINAVVTKQNIDDIPDLVDFCIDNNIDLKLLDLFENTSDFWKNQFVSLDEIESVLKGKCDKFYIQKQDEGFGSPEDVYEFDGTKIVLKNSTKGTCYSSICKECLLYPCQVGIVSFVLTHDGFLRLCTLNNINKINLKGLLNSVTYQETKEKIIEYFKIYNESKFVNSNNNEKCKV